MKLREWADADRLANWVDECTNSLLACVESFTDDDPRWTGPYVPEVNPPIWEIAHVAWFAEWFVLRQLHGQHDPLIEGADARYDSAKVQHRTRWEINYPSPDATRDYVRRVGDALRDVLGNDRGIDSTMHFVAYAVTHYDAHIEALTYTGQTLGWGTEPRRGERSADVVAIHDVSGDRHVAGGPLLLGAARSQPLVMDNEKWAHSLHVDAFDLAAAPVTASEFAEFIDDGGYQDNTLWAAGGWDALIEAPQYWRRGSDGWERRVGTSFEQVAEAGDHPMIHVSWFEAQAFCRWAGRRLPTEAEWEFAATTNRQSEREPWFPWGARDPLPHEANLDRINRGTAAVGAYGDGDGPWGHRQLIGNVWEWTSSTFEPYPHFEPDAYRDNSEPWFGTRKVLRGGSWATRNRYVRSTFRNFFTPDRRDVFAGFRTCANA